MKFVSCDVFCVERLPFHNSTSIFSLSLSLSLVDIFFTCDDRLFGFFHCRLSFLLLWTRTRTDHLDHHFGRFCWYRTRFDFRKRSCRTWRPPRLRSKNRAPKGVRGGFPPSSSSRTRGVVGRRPCCPIGTQRRRGNVGRRRFLTRLSRR